MCHSCNLHSCSASGTVVPQEQTASASYACITTVQTICDNLPVHVVDMLETASAGWGQEQKVSCLMDNVLSDSDACELVSTMVMMMMMTTMLMMMVVVMLMMVMVMVLMTKKVGVPVPVPVSWWAGGRDGGERDAAVADSVWQRWQNLEGSSLNRSPRGGCCYLLWRWTAIPREVAPMTWAWVYYVDSYKKDRNLRKMSCANAASLKHMAGQADASARGDFLGRGQEWKSFRQVETSTCSERWRLCAAAQCEKFMPQEVVRNNITKTRHLLLSLQDVLPMVFAGHICSQDIGNSIARQDVVKLTMQRVPDAQLRLRELSATRSETASGGMLAWLHLQWLHSQAWLCIHIATARKQHGAVVPGRSTKPYVRLILPPTTATRLWPTILWEPRVPLTLMVHSGMQECTIDKPRSLNKQK